MKIGLSVSLCNINKLCYLNFRELEVPGTWELEVPGTLELGNLGTWELRNLKFGTHSRVSSFKPFFLLPVLIIA